METARRKTYLDAIRLFASFGVIYNHVFGYRFFDTPGFGGIAAQFAFFLSKMAVPLFLMISGLLLLAREDSYKRTFVRILRIVIVLVAMCVFYNAVYSLQTGTPFTLRALVMSVYSQEPIQTDAFWYLYIYLSLLVMLPILQRLAAALDRRALRYYLLLLAACSVLPVLQQLCQSLRVNGALGLEMFSAIIGAPMLGLYIGRYMRPSRRGALLAAGGVLLFTVASVLLTRVDANAYIYGNLFYDRFSNSAIMAASGCAFYICKCVGEKAALPERAAARLTGLGRLTFCIFLFGDFFINLMQPLRARLTAGDTLYAGVLLYAVMVYAAAMLLAAVLTRIPGVKKLL